MSGAEERGYRVVPRAVAHEADAPALARELAQAATDLDVEALEQLAAHLGVVDAVGEPHRSELREPALFREEAEAEARAVRPAVARRRAAWRAHDASRPSSSSTPRPACKAYSIEIGAVWW